MLDIAVRVMPGDALVHHRNGLGVVERRHALRFGVNHSWIDAGNFHALQKHGEVVLLLT